MRNGAFNSKKETLISQANVWLKFSPRQILQFAMEAFGVHINLRAKVGINLTRQFLVCFEGHNWIGKLIWNNALGTLIPFKEPGALLNRKGLSISALGNCAVWKALVKRVQHPRKPKTAIYGLL